MLASHHLSMLKQYLDKLEPEAMMQPNGTRAAMVALGLLETMASDGGMAKELDAPGVKILIQTCVLHPVPDCRRAACAVLTAFTVEGDATFLSLALPLRLPTAFLRLLGEEDKRAKQADSPDLPARRQAIAGLSALLKCDGMVEQVLTADPTVAPGILKAGGSCDAQVRVGALRLALALTRDDAARGPVVAAAELEPPAAADLLLRVACNEAEPEGSDPAPPEPAPEAAEEASGLAVQLLLGLRGSSALRGGMLEAKAQERLAAALQQGGGAADDERAAGLQQLSDWLS